MGGRSTKLKKTNVQKINQLQIAVPKNIKEEIPPINKNHQNEENKETNLIKNECLIEKKNNDFFYFIDTIKKKNYEKFNWVDFDIINYDKKEKFELFKIQNKTSSEYFVLRLYSFKSIQTISEETKKEIEKLYHLYEEIEKLSCNFICKLISIDIQENYILFINEDGFLTLYGYILEGKKIKICEMIYYITTMLFNFIDIHDKIKDNPTFSETNFKIILYEKNSKIFFESNEDIYDVSKVDKIFSFFNQLYEVIKKNSFIFENKDFELFNKIISDIIENKNTNTREIIDLFLALNIDSKKPLLDKAIAVPIDEKLIEAYLNSANFFQNMNLNEQAKEYSIKAYNLMKFSKTASVLNTSKKDNFDFECLNLLTKLSLLNENMPKEHQIIAKNDSNEFSQTNNEEKVIELNNLALNYKNIGENKLAEQNLLKSLELSQNLDEENIEDTATILNNLGNVYYNQYDFTKAIKYYEKALGLHEKLTKKTDENLGKNYNNIGLIYKKMNDNEKAETFYKKSLEIFEEFPEKNKKNMASIYNNLGGLYHGLKQFEKAKEFYEKSFSLRLENLNEDQLNFAQSLNNLGTLYKDMGNLEKGKIYLEKSYEFYKKFQINHTVEKGICINNLAFTLLNLGEKKKSKVYFIEANEVWGRLFGENDELFKNNLEQIQAIN